MGFKKFNLGFINEAAFLFLAISAVTLPLIFKNPPSLISSLNENFNPTSQIASEDYIVQPIVFFPSDYPVDNAVVSHTNKMMGEIKTWYTSAGGGTFNLKPAVAITGSRDSKWYWCKNNESGCVPQGTLDNIFNRIKETNTPFFEKGERVINPIVFMGGGGFGGGDKREAGGFAVIGDLSIYPELDRSCNRVKESYFTGDSINSKNRCINEGMATNKMGTGTMAHEIGHAFGMPHTEDLGYPPSSDEFKRSIMQNHGIWPNNILAQKEKDILKNNPFLTQTNSSTPGNCGSKTCSAGQTCIGSSNNDSLGTFCLNNGVGALNSYCGKAANGGPSNAVCASSYCDPNTLKCATRPATATNTPIATTAPIIPLPNAPTNTKASAYCNNGKINVDVTFNPSNNANNHKVSYSFVNNPPTTKYNPVNNALTVTNVSKNFKFNYTSYACNSAGNCIEDQGGYYSINVGDPCNASAGITPAVTSGQSPNITAGVTPGGNTGGNQLPPNSGGINEDSICGSMGGVNTAAGEKGYLNPRCGAPGNWQTFDAVKAAAKAFCGLSYADAWQCLNGSIDFRNYGVGSGNTAYCSKAPWCPGASSGTTTTPSPAAGNNSCASLGGTCMDNVLYGGSSCTPSTGGEGKRMIQQGATGCTHPNLFCYVCQRIAVTPVPNTTTNQSPTVSPTAAQQSCYPDNPATNHCYNGHKDCCYPATRSFYSGQYFRCTSAIGTGTSYCTNANPPAGAQSVSSGSECSKNSDCKSLNKAMCVLNNQNIGTCE